MQLSLPNIIDYLDNSLKEDLGIAGDITSEAVVPKDYKVSFQINSRETAIICGLPVVEYFFKKYSAIKYKLMAEDGQEISQKQAIIEGEGNAREILLLERIVLNYLQHLSGIATITNQYVKEVEGTNAKVCDTRKTTPGLRSLQKYAVKCGGGKNHRLALDSSILIKDNHIAICGSISKAINLAKKHSPHYAKIEIECDNLDQVAEAVQNSADVIMLDNMDISTIKKAIEIIDNKATIEVSGGVTLENIKKIAQTGVDYISVGRLTHSVKAIDIGLDIYTR
jgi:nicotinate-nucleotide pyrophosphorylase (carboxylating)